MKNDYIDRNNSFCPFFEDSRIDFRRGSAHSGLAFQPGRIRDLHLAGDDGSGICLLRVPCPDHNRSARHSAETLNKELTQFRPAADAEAHAAGFCFQAKALAGSLI